MSKKEIRRAARDAFPKAKGARGRQGSSASSKRGRTVGTGSAASANVPKPPSWRRSLIIGAITAFALFALIEWAFHLNDATTYGNLAFAGVAFVLYTGLNYVIERTKYRRYLRKNKDLGR